jgi:hypothetical protein
MAENISSGSRRGVRVARLVQPESTCPQDILWIWCDICSSNSQLLSLIMALRSSRLDSDLAVVDKTVRVCWRGVATY